MIFKVQPILLASLLLGLSVPAQAQNQEVVPQVLESAISKAKSLHQDDYDRLKNLPDLAPEHYLKARVQKPTAARALKRLKLHQGVLIEAVLRPSLNLISAQVFPESMSNDRQNDWKNQSLLALQVGAAAALASQGGALAETLISYALHATDYRNIRPTLCVLYGQLARHSQGLAALYKIAQSSNEPLVEQSAIIGMGKMRLLGAFHMLREFGQSRSAPHIQHAVLHAYGHLANVAAQKANPMPDDNALHSQVIDELLKYLGQEQDPKIQEAALASLSTVLKASDLKEVRSRTIHPQHAKAMQRLFSRTQRRAQR